MGEKCGGDQHTMPDDVCMKFGGSPFPILLVIPCEAWNLPGLTRHIKNYCHFEPRMIDNNSFEGMRNLFILMLVLIDVSLRYTPFDMTGKAPIQLNEITRQHSSTSSKTTLIWY